MRNTTFAAFSMLLLSASMATAADAYFFRARPIVVAPLSTALAAKVSGTVALDGTTKAKPFSATGGTEPYTWSAVGLPQGMALDADGGLSASAWGTWNGLVATVRDSTGKTADVTFSATAKAPSGSLYAFGDNYYGQSKPNAPGGVVAAPQAVANGSDWTHVSAGEGAACAIKGGDIYCWGNNRSGSLGTGQGTTVTSGPLLVASGGWTQAGMGTGGQHACAAKDDTISCWGSIANGRLGLGNATAARPGQAFVENGSTGWSALSVAANHTCALKNGRLYCWGWNSTYQQGTSAGETNIPRELVQGVAGKWTHVSSGYEHTCAINDGKLYCFGSNSNGQLGRGTSGGQAVFGPADSGSTGWSAISSGPLGSCGIRDGRALCWGQNHLGQIGTMATSTADVPTPSFVGGGSGSTGWTAVAAGEKHSCGIRSGQLVCWGNDYFVGDGSTPTGKRVNPVAIDGGSTGWKMVSIGETTTYALK